MGFGGFDKTSKLTEWGVVASALLLPQVGARAGSALVNVTWTLKYEIFFYLLFSMRILNSKFGAALLISWQIAIVTFNLLNRSGTLELSSFYLSSLCLEFGVGICCAWLIGRPEFNNLFNRREIQWTVLAAGIAMFIGGMLVEKNIDSAGILCAFGAGATIIALIFLEQAAQISIPNFIVFLGSASYAIYLVHYSIITIFAIIITHIHILPLNNFVFIVAATIGVSVGICFDQLIDKPIQRLLQQKLKPILLNIHRNG
jgi:peptidoglycan/LPS O-acetylase OafA/YrhL